MTASITGDILEQLDAAFYAALTANSPLSALVGNRVFNQQAPAHTDYPYVIFQRVAGGFVNTSPRPGVEVVYQVECVALTAATARTGARFIHEALHRQRLPLVGWNNFATRGRDWFTPPVENVEGRQFWRRGGVYEARADQTT